MKYFPPEGGGLLCVWHHHSDGYLSLKATKVATPVKRILIYLRGRKQENWNTTAKSILHNQGKSTEYATGTNGDSRRAKNN